MKKLIKTDDFIKAAKLSRFGGKGTANVLMEILQINKINRLYSDLSHLEGIEFIDKLLEKLEITFEVSDTELDRIPKTGAFISISNHPFGGIDGLLLIKIISKTRPDIKVMANFLLQRVEPVKDYFLPVNPFEEHKDVKSSITGIKLALKHLKDGLPLGIFPAGEVSSFSEDDLGIADKAWETSALKMIKKSEVPVVPIYFQGANSKLFHLLGLIHPSLRTARLPSELFNKKNKVIRIRIGNPISVKEQKEFADIKRYGRYLRAKTYSLGSALEVQKFYNPNLFLSKKVQEIISPVDIAEIEKEISLLRTEYLLFETGEYQVYCTPSKNIPSIMIELGRLREQTFRLVGEGTNRSFDIDEFDIYYQQLFIWDDKEKKIVGAYRLGIGKEIMLQYGIKGFYIRSLFKIRDKIHPILNQSIELGRSFIVPEYQKKPLPLFMLWKGILCFLLNNPEYRYLIGPVSISNRFSNFSKDMIIKYIMKNHYNKKIGKYIKPRRKFVPIDFQNVDREILMDSSSDINKFDKFITDVDTSNFTLPVLLKKYLKLNGKIVGFNVDPKFNNALDGLLFLDLFDVPLETISALSKEINDNTIMERFTQLDKSKKKKLK
jgi:putative hemolysin